MEVTEKNTFSADTTKKYALVSIKDPKSENNRNLGES